MTARGSSGALLRLADVSDGARVWLQRNTDVTELCCPEYRLRPVDGAQLRTGACHVVSDPCVAAPQYNADFVVCLAVRHPAEAFDFAGGKQNLGRQVAFIMSYADVAICPITMSIRLIGRQKTSPQGLVDQIMCPAQRHYAGICAKNTRSMSKSGHRTPCAASMKRVRCW